MLPFLSIKFSDTDVLLTLTATKLHSQGKLLD